MSRSRIRNNNWKIEVNRNMKLCMEFNRNFSLRVDEKMIETQYSINGGKLLLIPRSLFLLLNEEFP